MAIWKQKVLAGLVATAGMWFLIGVIGLLYKFFSEYNVHPYVWISMLFAVIAGITYPARR